MSQANVERVRRAFEGWDPKARLEGWKRGEVQDEAVSLFDPDFAYEDDWLPDHMGETYHGLQGIIKASEEWLEPFESVDVELERIAGAGDRVVSIYRFRSKGRHSGIEVQAKFAYVFTFREGKVVHMRAYRDPAEALKAAGLSD